MLAANGGDFPSERSWLTPRIPETQNPLCFSDRSLKFELYAFLSRSKKLSDVAMHEPSFSALDRHAVLTGANDSFPWFAGAMLAMEASEVIRLRLEKFAQGGKDSEQEACLMVTEKIVAALQAGAQLLSGASPSAIIGLYRARVAANAKRLSAG
jgi:hypothetical protein